jgi:hypothetical protein
LNTRKTLLLDSFLAAATGVFDRHGPMASGKERAWGSLLRAEIERQPGVRTATDDAYRPDLAWPYWTRRPGPIDLVWDLDTSSCGAVELKIRKPDELIWDLIKVAEHTAGDERAFGFAAICVQIELSDFALEGGALVAGEQSRVQNPLAWIERWRQAWLKLMCGGRGIRPTSVPSALRLGAPLLVGRPDAAHWRIVPVVAADHGVREPLDEWGWPSALGSRPDGWDAAVHAADIYRSSPSKPQVMIDCHGYEVPARFRGGGAYSWVVENRAHMNPLQRAELVRLLKARGWKPDELARCGL